MKILELLVKELPGRGGWPDNAVQSWQSVVDGEIYFDSSCGKRVEYRNGNIYLPIVGNGLDEVITREQYEAAIAAQKPIAEFHSRTFPNFKAITVVERDDSWVGTKVDGEAYHCYKRHWNIELISNQPVWNGEGLPPVGCDVEFTLDTDKYSAQGNIPENGQVVNVVAHKQTTDGNPVAVVYWDERGSGRAAAFIKEAFSPLRTEADRKRESEVDELIDAITLTLTDIYASQRFMAAIAAGKIPGVELSK